MWDDLAQARRLAEFNAVIAVNDAGAAHEGELDVWATLHAEKLPGWVRQRAENGFPPARAIAAHAGNSEQGNPRSYPVDHIIDYCWPGMNASGSSGLFAVKVAIELGFDRIVLCGVPMRAADAHFFDSQPWGEVESFTAAWPVALPFIADKTRSMSGWTQELLGAPTPEWLAA